MLHVSRAYITFRQAYWDSLLVPAHGPTSRLPEGRVPGAGVVEQDASRTLHPDVIHVHAPAVTLHEVVLGVGGVVVEAQGDRSRLRVQVEVGV
jgi:hypothetical protein